MKNPLYDEWLRLHADATRDHLGLLEFPGATFEERYQRLMVATKAREEMCKQYSWAVPTLEVIEAIAQFSPFVEVGAGRGYWASLIQEVGGEIDCFDENPPDISETNPWCPPHEEWDNTFIKVHQAGPEIAAAYPEATLLLCWPPYNTPMAYDSLRQYEGQRLVFVGEGYGGCCGDDAFWKLLDSEWNSILTYAIPNWWSIRDYVSVWERKK